MALRQFLMGSGKTAGRNSSGRITVFHRGGGAKRLQRRVDVKRSTSSMGIVERIEYDPNRSSRIALVRWFQEYESNPSSSQFPPPPPPPPPRRIVEPATSTTVRAVLSFCSLPGKVGQRKVASSSFSPGLMAAPHLVVGSASCKMPPWSKSALYSKKTCAKDVFSSAFSSSKASGSSFALPRVAVAGAKPAFFATQIREEALGDKTSSVFHIRKGTRPSNLGYKVKRKAALSWPSLRLQGTVFGAAKDKESKLKKKDQGSERPKNGACEINRAPVTYVIASHHLERGKMVMNCDWSKSSNSNEFFEEKA